MSAPVAPLAAAGAAGWAGAAGLAAALSEEICGCDGLGTGMDPAGCVGGGAGAGVLEPPNPANEMANRNNANEPITAMAIHVFVSCLFIVMLSVYGFDV